MSWVRVQQTDIDEGGGGGIENMHCGSKVLYWEIFEGRCQNENDFPEKTVSI